MTEVSNHCRRGSDLDPTHNVLLLVSESARHTREMREAEIRRIDDLREADRQLRESETRRINDLTAQAHHYNKELAQSESDRIDALRVVDVNNVALANAKAADQATVLANALATSADKTRAESSAMADALAKQAAAANAELSTRIAALEKANSEGVGKQRVADPMLADFMADMRSMLIAQGTGKGRSEGSNATVAWIIAGVSVAGGLIATTISLIKFSSGG